MDLADSPRCVDVGNIERDVGVFHPEALLVGLFEYEQHSLVFWHGFPMHQTLRFLRSRDCDLQLERNFINRGTN